MAAETLKDVLVTIGAVDLSSMIKSVRIPINVDTKVKTGFGDTTETTKPGIKRWELGIDWYGDYAAAGVWATIEPLIGVEGTEVTVKPKSDATAATNPLFTGDVIVNDFPWINAQYGEMHEFSTTWPGDGDYTNTTS